MKIYVTLILLSIQTFLLNAQDFQFYYDRGKICSSEKNRIDSAVIYFTKAIELDSSKSGVYLERARLYDYKGKLLIALRDYNKVIEMDSLCGRAYQGRANIYMKMKRRDEAMHDYKMSIELLADDEKTFYSYANLGIYLFDEGENIDTSLYYFTKAIDLSKKYKYNAAPSCYYFRGKAYLIKGEYEKAIDDFTTAIDLNFSSDCYLLRSTAYKKLGLNDKAKQDEEKYEASKINGKKL
jgi:tetratricopeptide (TPR) repeat protein